MHLECPNCQAHYDILTDSDDVVFVCHRCEQEFSPSQHAEKPCKTTHWQPAETGQPTAPWLKTMPLARQVESESEDITEPHKQAPDGQDECPETTTEAQVVASSESDMIGQEHIIPADDMDDLPVQATESAEMSASEPEKAPVRKSVHIWPWFMVLLIIIAASGFWIQKDAWLDNRWFRSTLMNTGFSMPMRDKDWYIIPDSVKSEWINRKDGSKALLIQGQLQNLLSSEMPLPAIDVVFFSRLEPAKSIGAILQHITIFPDKAAIKKVPYNAPDKDTIPVPARSQRTFIFLLESVPAGTGDFTLTPRVEHQ